MTVKTGQAWAGAFVTLDATGALEAGTPSGVLYVDGVANAATVTITGSNPYKWAVTLPALTAGQRVDMYITATISTIATAGFVASEQADTTLLSDGVTLADDAITSAKFDESTAFPVKSADTGATAIARVGADSDTLKTLSDQIDAVKAETASILEDTGTTIPGTITTIDNEIAVIDGIVDSILEDTGTTLDTKINTIDDFLDTEVAAILADTNELQTDWVNGGRLDSLIDAIKTKTDTITTPPTAASVADAVWDEAIADHTTATTFGGKNQKVVPSETIGDYKADVSGLATTTHVQEVEDKVDTIDGNVDAVLLDTGTDGVKIASGELSDLALEATLTAMKGAGWTDETLVALMTAIEAISAGSGATAQEVWEYTTRVLTAGTNIDISSLATAANLAALDGKVDTVDGIVDAILADTNELQTDLTNGGRLDMLIDAIKAKTDNLPADPADDSDIDAQLAAIKAETALIVEDTATTIPATLATIEGKIDTADTVVDAIKAKTDNLPTDPADDSDIDTAIAAVKTVVDAILVDTGTTLDGKITAILADTNELQAELADGGRTDLLIDAILEDTGTTIPGTITTIDNEVAVIDGIVDAILADTNELQTDLTDGGRLDLLIDAIKTETASILEDTGTDGVKLADDAITAGKFDESTAFPLKSADTGATALARTGADSDTLETLSDQMDAIKTETASILEDTGTDGVVLTAGAVDAILDEVVVGTYTMRQLLTVFASALAGKLSGGGTTTLTFRGINDASDVIVATVDANGNRSDLTITV